VKNKLTILICAGVAYSTRFAPSTWLRDRVLHHFGHPRYHGFWAFIPHVFLYSTLGAAVCALTWVLLSRRKLLPPIPLGRGSRAVVWGLLGGGAIIALSFAFLLLGGVRIHFIPPDAGIYAGNLFSNFYEEFIYRGFLLTALGEVFGFWPAALISSVAFGLEHTQYPLPLQALIAVSGVLWCFVRKKSGTLWAPYLSHELLDAVMDLFVS
jgi:membrane protease YdiL (CAAX protease family)